MAHNSIQITRWQSPAGEMLLGSFGDKICLCDWALGPKRQLIDHRLCRVLNADYHVGASATIEKMINELEEYFSGKRISLDIPIQFAGTEFQCRVWRELMNIPYGTTITYGELAHRAGNAAAVRAVASATATNPISIFVPCHRVIGSNNKLTGYGGGLDAKRFLLTLEFSVVDFNHSLSGCCPS